MFAGPVATRAILKLVSTLMVIVRIMQQLAPREPSIQLLLQVQTAFITKPDATLSPVVDPMFETIVRMASNYVAKTNKDFPLVCSNLELGQSWEQVVFKMLTV